jgi:hypothetical protein
MTSNALLPTDVVVRFDPSTGTVSLLTIPKGQERVTAHVIHEHAWQPKDGVSQIVDIGGAVCAYLHAAHTGLFYSPEQWEEIAAEIRRAAGRDDEG